MKLHRVSPKCEETWRAKNIGPLCTGFYMGFRRQASFQQLDSLAFGRYESSNLKLNLRLTFPASRVGGVAEPGEKRFLRTVAGTWRKTMPEKQGRSHPENPQ